MFVNIKRSELLFDSGSLSTNSRTFFPVRFDTRTLAKSGRCNKLLRPRSRFEKQEEKAALENLENEGMKEERKKTERTTVLQFYRIFKNRKKI